MPRATKEELEWAYAVTREKFLERVNKKFPIKADDWNRYLDGIFELISNDEAPLYEPKMNAYLNEIKPIIKKSQIPSYWLIQNLTHNFPITTCFLEFQIKL